MDWNKAIEFVKDFEEYRKKIPNENGIVEVLEISKDYGYKDEIGSTFMITYLYDPYALKHEFPYDRLGRRDESVELKNEYVIDICISSDNENIDYYPSGIDNRIQIATNFDFLSKSKEKFFQVFDFVSKNYKTIDEKTLILKIFNEIFKDDANCILS